MRTLAQAALALLPVLIHAQPVFQWAKTISNAATPGQLGITRHAEVAPDGTIYVTGSVNGPRAIVGDNLVEGSSFLARYDAGGDCLWARNLGGVLALNGNDGAYVVGKFTGSMLFGADNLSAAGQDAYVAKYDANGNKLWAKKMGGALDDGAYSVAVDGLGRVHVTGYFRGTGTFGGTTLVATHDSTGFHATLDANGDFQWAVLAGGFESWDPNFFMFNDLTCDDAGNTYMTGVFSGTASFGASMLSTADFDALYLARFDASGNCTWVHEMGAEYGNDWAMVQRAPTGSIYLFGQFAGSLADFGGGITLNNSAAGWTDTYLAYFDMNGEAQWAQTLAAGTVNQWAQSLDVDDDGDAWVTATSTETSTVGPFSVEYGSYIAEVNASGTVLEAQNMMDGYASLHHVIGASGEHYFNGYFSQAEFDTGSGTNVIAALLDGEEGYFARYEADLSFTWMRRMGLHGMAAEGVSGLATDPAGNVYTAGNFFTTAIICDDTLRAPIAATHIWLNKRDADGDCVWTKQIRCSEPNGMNQTNQATSLARAANGDLILAGYFWGTIDFGPVQLTSAGKQDLFLARFDANGNCLWAIAGGGPGEDAGSSVAIDANGDILLIGWYSGNATIAGTALSSEGFADGFLCRMNANGNGLWCKSFGGSSWDNGYGLALDDAGNAYITGRFTTAATFDALTVNGTGDADLYVAKYDPSGNLSWLTGSTAAGWKQARAIVVGASDQIYITGEFSGELTICTETLMGDPVNLHPFLSCFDMDGALLWQKEFPCGSGSGRALAARPGGDIVATGGFSGTITVGATTINGTGGQEAWISAFNSAGDELWVHGTQGEDFWDLATVSAVVADESTVHAIGSFGDFYFTSLDQDPGNCTLAPGVPGSLSVAPNSSDGFILKFSSAENISPPFNPIACDGTVRLPEHALVDAVTLQPNPVQGFFTVRSARPISASAKVTLRDMTGRLVHAAVSPGPAGLVVDATALRSGPYAITVASAEAQATLRFIKE